MNDSGRSSRGSTSSSERFPVEHSGDTVAVVRGVKHQVKRQKSTQYLTLPPYEKTFGHPFIPKFDGGNLSLVIKHTIVD